MLLLMFNSDWFNGIVFNLLQLIDLRILVQMDQQFRNLESMSEGKIDRNSIKFAQIPARQGRFLYMFRSFSITPSGKVAYHFKFRNITNIN